MKTKKLFIVRHAKAELHSFSKDDYYRDLIEKGIVRLQRLALEVKPHLHIDSNTLFISSSANRAIQTATIFSEIVNYPLGLIVQTKSIYEAHYKTILEEVNKVPNHIDTLVIFGHNPGLSDLTNYLCNSYISLKTSAIAEIKLEEGLNFSELSGNTATLKQIFSE